MKDEYKILFEPVRIGKMELKNRFCMSPMGNGGLAGSEGEFTEEAIEYFVARARGGVGMLTTGICVVEDEIEGVGRGLVPCTAFNVPVFIRQATQLCERVHAYDAKMVLQLTSGGGRINNPNWSMKGKSMTSASENSNRWNPEIITRALTTEEVKKLIQRMVISAGMAKAAGFDAVEIHAVHEGYLMDQFATEIFNHRTDEYGGNLENRLRFATEVVQGIKRVCGPDFPVILRFSTKHMMKALGHGAVPGEKFQELGRDMEESLEAAKILEAAGYDAFDADVGCYDAHYWSHPPMYLGKGVYLPFNEQLKKVVTVPVISAGRMDDPDLASSAVRKGQTDLIGLGRPLLADPELVNKIKADQLEDIRPCMSCHDGCFEHMGTLLSCAVRPQTGREVKYQPGRAETMKNVVIVGGGVGGLEAARVCAIRGHQVTLVERGDKLGGNLLPAGQPSFKENDRKLAAWYEKQLRDLKVTVQLNTEATKENIAEMNPEVVILATGSIPKKFVIPGDDSIPAMTAVEVLQKEKDPGEYPLIIGGGLVGCELALAMLKDEGKPVAICEALPNILSSGAKMNFCNKDMLTDLLHFYQADIYTSAKVERISGGKVQIRKAEGDASELEASSVIFATGFDSRRDLYEEIKLEPYDVRLVGDARNVQNIMHAVWDAYEVARNI